MEKSFSEEGKIRKYIHGVHEGHKDYSCDSCGKSFSQSSNLNKHIYTVHEGHKDYKCESCGESFVDTGKLKQHIHIIHEGRKKERKIINMTLAINYFLKQDLWRSIFTEFIKPQRSQMWILWQFIFRCRRFEITYPLHVNIPISVVKVLILILNIYS